MIDLSGKTALITGAGRGIGFGCALELARHGSDVVINDRPGSPDLNASAEQIRDLGRQCTAIEADVFSRHGCELLVREALQVVERIDILISNPAFSQRSGFLECSPDLFQQTINGTLTSGFHMSQLVARHMVERGGGGRIVFISSVQAELPIARCFAYGAAKAALNHMTRSVAVELAEHHINVNAIEPGWIDTPGEHDAFDSQTLREKGNGLPWGRLGTPSDIGQAATFLASDSADYISGTVLAVDGLFRYKDCQAEPTRDHSERPAKEHQ